MLTFIASSRREDEERVIRATSGDFTGSHDYFRQRNFKYIGLLGLIAIFCGDISSGEI